jgi:hypothetical protein
MGPFVKLDNMVTWTPPAVPGSEHANHAKHQKSISSPEPSFPRLLRRLPAIKYLMTQSTFRLMMRVHLMQMKKRVATALRIWMTQDQMILFRRSTQSLHLLRRVHLFCHPRVRSVEAYLLRKRSNVANNLVQDLPMMPTSHSYLIQMRVGQARRL